MKKLVERIRKNAPDLGTFVKALTIPGYALYKTGKNHTEGKVKYGRIHDYVGSLSIELGKVAICAFSMHYLT